MATPMSLPITPDEQLTDSMPMPPVSSYNPVYTAVQEFPSNHTPSPSLPLTPESLTPLSPESLVSPESFCNSDEVDEVLSYLSSDPMTPLGPNDAFNVFPSPTSNQIYNENCKQEKIEQSFLEREREREGERERERERGGGGENVRNVVQSWILFASISCVLFWSLASSW